MAIILTCGAAFLLAIGLLALTLAVSAKGEAWEEQAIDEEQMAALLMQKLVAELEDGLFDAK